MIDVEHIDPFSLPSVPLPQRKSLPVAVGKSVNLYQRWVNHHRINQIQSRGDVIIAWIAVEDTDAIESLEKACIKHFDPIFNETVIPDEFIPESGKRKSLRLSEDLEIEIEKLAKKHHRSKNAEIIVAVEQYVRSQKSAALGSVHLVRGGARTTT